jgi:radical SAM-linked protein
MSEMRQRWRLTVRRGPDARDVAHRDVVASWEAALRASGLPLAETQAATPRPRIAFAAPLPVGMLGEHELIDVGLTECRQAHEVRHAVLGAIPSGHELVDMHDVWTGAPTLPSLVVAADYRVRGTVLPAAARQAVDKARTDEGTTDKATTDKATTDKATTDKATTDKATTDGGGAGRMLDAAVGAFLASARVETQREKGGGAVSVDIRPLVLRLQRTASLGDGAFALHMRLRLGGAGGVGRPEEIVAALGVGLPGPLRIDELVRERILLADDPPEAGPQGPAHK